LGSLFASGPEALGSSMAGRAEEEVGDPYSVSLSVSILASDIIAGMADESGLKTNR
jgi:hypothetical protein